MAAAGEGLVVETVLCVASRLDPLASDNFAPSFEALRSQPATNAKAETRTKFTERIFKFCYQ